MEKHSSMWAELDQEFGKGKVVSFTRGPTEKSEPVLKVRTANQCIQDAKLKPIPRMLFAEFWHEGELAILFADTNVGKSILAVQIGDNISHGRSPPELPMQAGGQPVLYLDFELSDKQFQQRYSMGFERKYHFSNTFYRVEISPEFSDFGRFEEALKAEIEAVVAQTGAKVLIVDNLPT